MMDNPVFKRIAHPHHVLGRGCKGFQSTSSLADRVAGDYDKHRVEEYMKMLDKVEKGDAEQWQATQLFKKMTGPDMNEIARRQRGSETRGHQCVHRAGRHDR